MPIRPAVPLRTRALALLVGIGAAVGSASADAGPAAPAAPRTARPPTELLERS
ncbi:MAG: hypothetical protein ACKO22_08760 [Cyanobium sp.]